MSGGAILGLDTATPDCAVCVALAGSDPIELREGPADGARPRHAAAIGPLVDSAVAGAGGWERIEAVAVGIGPGGFTGLRVGVATARALAQARGLGVCAVGSLAALARGIGAREPERPRLAVFDARRGEVFAGLYASTGAELLAPRAISPGELTELLRGGDTPLAAGDGSLRFRGELEGAGVEVLPAADPAHRISARHVCALARGMELDQPTEIRPAYLRRPDAEVWREQRDRDPAAG